VETLCLMAGVGLPHAAIREQLGRGIDLVVHIARLSDGARRVTQVAEVVRAAGGVGVRELYRRGERSRSAIEASWRS
jgi:pilus assembly protein CpaF